MLFQSVCLNEWLSTATTLLPSLESIIIHSVFTPSLPTSHIWILFFKWLLIFLLPLATNLVMLSLILWISTSYHCCLTSHCSLHIRQIISFLHSFFLINFLLKDNCFTEFFCFLSDLNMNHIPSFLKLFSNVILSKLLYFSYLLHWHLNSSCNLSKTLSLHICFLCV